MKQQSQENKLLEQSVNLIKTNKYARYTAILLGGILVLFVGGKIMRIMASFIVDVKILKSAIKS
jgi:hypothetical protein